MAAKDSAIKERIATLIEGLPTETLVEVLAFLESQRSKLDRARADLARPVPVKLGGIWAGVEITDEDIAETRREMWRNFGERDF
jgi:hypothetical protein